MYAMAVPTSEPLRKLCQSVPWETLELSMDLHVIACDSTWSLVELHRAQRTHTNDPIQTIRPREIPSISKEGTGLEPSIRKNRKCMKQGRNIHNKTQYAGPLSFTSVTCPEQAYKATRHNQQGTTNKAHTRPKACLIITWTLMHFQRVNSNAWFQSYRNCAWNARKGTRHMNEWMNVTHYPSWWLDVPVSQVSYKICPLFWVST